MEPLRQLIWQQEADIICLQEAHPTQVALLLSNDVYEVCYDLTDALKTDKGKVYTQEEERFLKMHGVAVILLKKTAGFAVLEKRLVFEGDFIDTGAICVKLKKNDQILYVYNNHFTGGSYGLDEHELKRRRQYRIDQYGMLLDDVKSVTKKEKRVSFVLTGDFNSDADKLDQFPEASNALELVLPPGNDAVPYGFVDLWNALSKEQDSDNDAARATESTSRNKFRAYLKPNQTREVRYDRILLGLPSDRSFPSKGSIQLVGDKRIDIEVLDKEGNNVPVFPSDHFGVSATLSDSSVFPLF